MIPYIFIFIFLFYAAWECDIKGVKKYANTYFVIAFFIFFLFAALRYNIGGDAVHMSYNWYKYPVMFSDGWFERYQKMQLGQSFITRYQPGWMYYAMFVRSINPNFVTLQIITSLLLNIAIFRIVKKYSQYPFLTLFIFYLTFSFILLEFEVIRESVAISVFLLLGFDNWVKKKWLLYYLANILAYLVHPSALLMFVFPIFRYLTNKSTKTYFVCFVLPVLVIAILCRSLFGNLVADTLEPDSSMMLYANRALDMTYNSNYIYPRLIQPGILFIAIIYFRKYMVDWYIPLLVYVIMIFIMALYDLDMPRFANYIIIPAYIGITPVIKQLIIKYKTMWIGVGLVLFFSVPNMMIQYNDPVKKSRYFPYQNVITPHQTKIQKKNFGPISAK